LVQGTYADNFTQKEFFQKYDAHLQAYIPFNKYFSLAVHVGGTTVVNDDVLNSGQPYEHAIIGGPRYLRGYRRERFWGKTAYYNNNELRFITDFRTHLMNGRIGLLGFFDNGRVWMPDESSNKLHISYGPGLLLSPFNKFCVILTYGITEEIRLFQLRLNTLF
jgi:hemolysin activation/secretion protein